MRKVTANMSMSLDGFIAGPIISPKHRPANAHRRIAELKHQPGAEILMFGSRRLWNDLLDQDLVDEIHLMIGPVVLAAGTPRFNGKPPASLRLMDTRTWKGPGNVLVRYDVRPQKA